MNINEIKEPWGENLIEEHTILKDKYSKLIDYISSEEFFKLSPNYLKLINNQKTLMETYIKTISTRLFEDIDKACIVDYSFLGLMLGMFTSSPFSQSVVPPSITGIKQTEEILELYDS